MARELGLDPKAVAGFLNGSTPRVSTRQRLEQWYVEHAISESVASVPSVRAALSVLIQDLPPSDRDEARAELLACLGGIYKRRHAPIPAWLGRVEEERDS